MSVSGHKSANGLIPCTKVDNEEKMKMGLSLSKMLTSDDDPDTIRQNVDQHFQKIHADKKKRKHTQSHINCTNAPY